MRKTPIWKPFLLLLALTLVFGLVVPVSATTLAGADDATSSGPEAQEQEKKKEKKKKEKKPKKQRGKVVTARVVTEPSPAESEEAEPGETPAEPAPSAASEPARATESSQAPRSSAAPDPVAPAREPVVSTPRASSAPAQPAPVPEAEPVAVREVAPDPVAPPAAPPVAAESAPGRDRTADRPRRSRDQRPRGQLNERIVVSEVLLDVLVTDRSGDVVTGLGPEDFVVIEDGEEREVTSVTFYGTAPELRGSGVEGETRSDRYFILFFHDQAQAFPSLMAAQLDTGRRARQWVDQELLPNDQVAVLGYDVRLKVYQDFTRDRDALDEAIKLAAAGKKEQDRGWRDPEIPVSADSPSLTLNLPRDKELARQTRKLQEALALVGRASEGIVGRKNLLLFSVGFGDLLDGGLWHPDPRYYPDMKESLNDGNVAVYAIDLLGTRGNPAARDINDALSSIANDTGGYYYSLFTNALTPLRQVTEDNLGYYLLSYRSEYERGSSGYREVEVETRDKRHKVRGRKGYRYGMAAATPASAP